MRRNRLKEVYLLISEPRSIRLLYAVIYLCIAGAGLSLIFNTPLTFGTVNSVVVFFCGAFAVLGGLFGTGFVLTKLWAWERIGTVLVGTALLAYLIAVLYSEFFTNTPGSRLSTAFILAALIVTMAIRWMTLRTADNTDPIT